MLDGEIPPRLTDHLHPVASRRCTKSTTATPRRSDWPPSSHTQSKSSCLDLARLLARSSAATFLARCTSSPWSVTLLQPASRALELTDPHSSPGSPRACCRPSTHTVATTSPSLCATSSPSGQAPTTVNCMRCSRRVRVMNCGQGIGVHLISGLAAKALPTQPHACATVPRMLR